MVSPKFYQEWNKLFMKTDKFKVIQFIRELILAVDKQLDNFPKKDIELKNRIRTSSFDLLELAYEANTSDDIVFKKIQVTKMISRVKIIDFLLNLSFEKELITQKKYYKLAARIDDIIKYTTGWLKSLN